MGEIQRHIVESPEVRENPPFQVGDLVRVKNPKEMINIINKPFHRLRFGRSQHKIISIKWYEDEYRKCWVVELSNCSRGDFYNAGDFELVKQADAHEPIRRKPYFFQKK